MAVAEARAAWQRTVNRCLVQEDAKRAPKLAYCPSVSPSAREVDVRRSATDAQDIPNAGFLPFHRNTSYSNLSPNSRWWLQLQPNYRHLRGLPTEQLNSVESEMEISQSGVSSALPNSEDDGSFVCHSTGNESIVDSDLRISTTSVKNDIVIGSVEVKPLCKQKNRHFPKLEDRGASFESAEVGTDGCAASKKTNEVFPYAESPWIGDEKTEPWWRIADQDELALLVAQRSLGLVENCDLPQPQNTCVKRETLVDLCCIDHEGTCISPIDSKHPGCCDGLTTRNWSNIASEGARQKQWLPVDCHSQSSTITFLRDGANQGALPRRSIAERDSSKAELLEALRHSQTRAREAENAAKQAYEEKEHVVKLVFRQASQLFAYKQWFQLLQLENLCYQIKNNKSQPISTLFPVMLPWMPQKPRKSRKSWQKAGRGKRGKKGRGPGCEISKYAVALALGLSLVGAGLFLGWTVGWMLPTF